MWCQKRYLIWLLLLLSQLIYFFYFKSKSETWRLHAQPNTEVTNKDEKSPFLSEPFSTNEPHGTKEPLKNRPTCLVNCYHLSPQAHVLTTYINATLHLQEEESMCTSTPATCFNKSSPFDPQSAATEFNVPSWAEDEGQWVHQDDPSTMDWMVNKGKDSISSVFGGNARDFFSVTAQLRGISPPPESHGGYIPTAMSNGFSCETEYPPGYIRILFLGDSIVGTVMRAMHMVFQRDLFFNTSCFGDRVNGFFVEERWPVNMAEFERSPIQLLHFRAWRLDTTNPLLERITAHYENCNFGLDNCTKIPFHPTHIVVNRMHDYLSPLVINANGLRSFLYPLLIRVRVLYPRSMILYQGTYQRSTLRDCEAASHVSKYRAAEWTTLRMVNEWILREQIKATNLAEAREIQSEKWRPILFVTFHSLVLSIENTKLHSSLFGGDSLHYNPNVAEKMGRVVLRHFSHHTVERLLQRDDQHDTAQRILASTNETILSVAPPPAFRLCGKCKTHWEPQLRWYLQHIALCNLTAKTSTQAQPPAKTSTQAQPPAKTSTQAQPPAKTSTQAQPPAKTSTQAQPPAKSSTQAQPPAKTSTQAQPPPKASTQTRPPVARRNVQSVSAKVGLSEEPRLRAFQAAHPKGTYTLESVVNGPPVRARTCGALFYQARWVVGNLSEWNLAVLQQEEHTGQCQGPSFNPFVATTTNLLRWCLAHVQTYAVSQFVEDVRLMRRGLLQGKFDVCALAVELPVSLRHDVVTALISSSFHPTTVCETSWSDEECSWEQLVSILSCNDYRLGMDVMIFTGAPSVYYEFQPEFRWKFPLHFGAQLNASARYLEAVGRCSHLEKVLFVWLEKTVRRCLRLLDDVSNNKTEHDKRSWLEKEEYRLLQERLLNAWRTDRKRSPRSQVTYDINKEVKNVLSLVIHKLYEGAASWREG